MHLRPSAVAALFATLSFSHFAGADGSATAQYLSGRLTLDVSGADVSLQLRLPMTRSDATTKEKQDFTQEEVLARVKAADKLFIFPDKAKCVVESANAFAVDTQGKPTKGEGNIQAMYRFSCPGASAGRIDSVKIRLTEGLPGLDKIKLQVSTDKGEQTLELAPANADVAL
jgi:hypothetical protein